MANLIDQVSAARQAFAVAGMKASQTTRDLFERYGYTMSDGQGGYTTTAAANAWDPARLAAGTGGGAYMEGGTGELADIRRAGGEEEALLTEKTLMSGLGGSGLAEQRRRMAEAKTSGAVKTAQTEFERMLAGIQGEYLGAQTTMESEIMSAERSAAEETAQAYAENPTPEERVFGYGKPGGKPPKYGKKDKGKTYKGPGGVTWTWDGKGWKKKVGA